MATIEETLQEIYTNLLKECYEIGRVYHGIATHIIDMQNFYIVPISLYRMLPMLETPGKSVENVQVLANVIYYSPTLRQFARGSVRSIKPNRNCVIFALDYGVEDTEIIPNSIFEMSHETIESVPGLAQLCELVMCFPCSGDHFTEENIESFKFFMGQEREKLTVTIMEKTNHKLGVRVMSSNSNPDDVSATMHYTKNSVLWSSRP